MRAVIDTNVLVSAFLSPTGAPAHLLRLFEQGAFVLLVSEAILAEYQRALGYPKLRARHGLSPAAVAAVIDDLRAGAVLVADAPAAPAEHPGAALPRVAPDPDDDKFFACAVAGDAAYIISGDAHVQAVGVYHGIVVVSPTLFVRLLRQGPAEGPS